ncbi:MAG: substrate-binding domain-containing protein [Akkermansiaceae bacterium]|nr:substrate-binding domain-containing protein [Akkermansiaceae bacterium]MCP5548083.1 substrate-binding domain-containing protein [Akkermansiaceae bacterium]
MFQPPDHPMSLPRKSQIPRRHLLTDQTAGCIRERISEGEWSKELPTEAALCRELQVSRVTLRRALQQLTDEGLVMAAGRGVRRRINPAKVGTPGLRSGRIIRALAPFSHWKMGAVHHAILEGLSHRVDSRNFRVQFESRPQLFSSHRPAELERLIALPDTVGWVLFFSTEPMQRWFAESGVPCVVAGRLFDDFALPSAYPDNEAVAKHAAGMLVARGHRQMVFLIARQTSLGDRLASAAFREQAHSLGADAQVVEYSGDPGSVCRAMNSVLAIRPAPTAFYLTCPEDGVTVLCHALKAGISVPGQIDILIGWDDPILDYTVPALTHYRFDGAKMGRKIGTLLLHRIENRGPKARETKFLGEFFTGGTLRPASAK